MVRSTEGEGDRVGTMQAGTVQEIERAGPVTLTRVASRLDLSHSVGEVVRASPARSAERVSCTHDR